MLTSEEPSSLSGAPPTRRAGAGADATDRDRHGCWAGGVSTIGGRGGGLGLAGGGPGAGRTSIGGGSGAACWLITGGAGAAGGRGGATTAFGERRGSRPGSGTSGGAAGSGKAAVDGEVAGGSAGGVSPRSMASSLRVSRSMTRTASHDDSEVTSSIGLSASGVPVAKTWISGWLVAEPIELEERLARTSAWSASMS